MNTLALYQYLIYITRYYKTVLRTKNVNNWVQVNIKRSEST